MIQIIRKWFFKLFFGISLEEFMLGNIEATSLRNDVKELQAAYIDLLKEWLNLQESISHLQQAMLNLNDSMGKMSESQKYFLETITSHDNAIKQLVQLGQIHNEHFAELAKKFQQKNESAYTSTPKPDKLN